LIFRSLEVRIVVFFVALLVVVQAVAFSLISAANQQIAKSEIASQLNVGSNVFRRLIDQNGRQLAQGASVLAADFAFREAIATRDMGTILSVLGNHGARISAHAVLLAGLDKRLLADTLHPGADGQPFPFPDLIALAQKQGQARAIVLLDNKPYQFVVVPVLAPLPIAWVAMGFAIDDQIAIEMKALTTLQISFVSGQANRAWNLNASTLTSAEREALTEKLMQTPPEAGASATLSLEGEDFQTVFLALNQKNETAIIAVLQQSLRTALEPFNRLRNTLLILALVSILVLVLGSVIIGRSLVKPINRLAKVARRISDGDYTQRVDIDQQDEIGALATSFNQMKEAVSSREEKITRLAYHDTLTNLPNRALFNDRLDQALRSAERTKSAMTMLMMDLDRFKLINDSLGHQVGDMVLREVGARLQGLLRKSDTVARLGGDEFALVLPDVDEEQALPVTEKILAELEKPIMVEGQPLDVGASIGIASYPAHGDDPNTIARRADIAMYVAKRGNLGFVIYKTAHEKSHEGYLTLLGELRRAVDQDELVLYYQPKIDLQSGKTLQVEALVRWNHPVRGFVPPFEFIPFAEQTGYIRTLTRWIIGEAIRQCKEWCTQGMDIVISVNISSRDLLDLGLPDMVSGELQKHDLAPQFLGIEITESGFMEDPAQALEILKRLDELGVKLSIDDYGTGYSSLSYLKKLPVHELKIDMSFVKNMSTDKNDATIVKSTIDLGHNMGLKVVAEGVESLEILQLLGGLGCDLAQGFFMSKPLPAKEFEAWYRQGILYFGRAV